MTLLPDERVGKQAAVMQVRSHLRRAILDGKLPPRTMLSQERLARELSVSRTPLREALRMLQEEGLVVADTHRHLYVADIDMAAVESLYASRIMLETLALAVTLPLMSDADIDTLANTLNQMHVAGEHRDIETWEEGNRTFHQLISMHTEDHLRATIQRNIEASTRYRRIKLRALPQAWEIAEADHAAILNACRERNRVVAVRELARHLARTALTVIAQVDPEYEPRAIRTALQLVTGLP